MVWSSILYKHLKEHSHLFTNISKYLFDKHNLSPTKAYERFVIFLTNFPSMLVSGVHIFFIRQKIVPFVVATVFNT